MSLLPPGSQLSAVPGPLLFPVLTLAQPGPEMGLTS